MLNIHAQMKYERVLAPFLYLWKTDNKDWLKQRKADWKYIAANNLENDSQKNKARLKKFFLTGEYQGHSSLLFYLTPFDSAEAMYNYFYSEMYSDSERKNMAFLNRSNYALSGVAWERSFNQLYVKAILGERYIPNDEQSRSGEEITLLIHPSSFCTSFLVKVNRLLELTDLSYHAYIETVDYFVTVLPYFVDKSFRTTKRRNMFYQMLERAECINGQSDAPAIAKEVAQKLCHLKKEMLHNWNINSHLDETV